MKQRIAALTAVVALCVLDGAAQQPSFSSAIEAVRVDALVTEHGQPVRGLGAGDFEIVDEGVPQQIDLVSFEQVPLNVILTLDMSDSVAGDRLEHLRSASRSALATLDRGDQAALVTFNQAVSLRSPLTGDIASVSLAIDRASGSGETSLVDGVFAAMMIGQSDVGRALLIVFSDGVDTASWLQPGAVLDAAKRSDAVAYTVSVQSRLKSEFLRDLTSATGGRLFEIEKTADLEATFRAIVEEFRHRYLLSYTPRGVAKDGWHRLDVRVKRKGIAIKARPGYLRS